MVRLNELLSGEEAVVTAEIHPADLEITGIASDSRQVAPGNLFAALPGTLIDGRRFIDDAVRRGATAILLPEGSKVNDRSSAVTLITDTNPRKRYAEMAARYFARQPDTIVAVTGTNGKTSVAVFLRQIWSALGLDAASTGTLGTRIMKSGKALHLEGNLTTPDPVELHAMLAGLKGRGVEHLAIEASSHGLDQYRLDGVAIRAAAFTNLSRDHLDYHGDEQCYFNAKRRLFKELLVARGTAVLNADHPRSRDLREDVIERGCRILSVGADGEDIRLLEQQPYPGGQKIRVELFGRQMTVDLPLIGGFQSSNALVSLGLAIGCGADAQAASETLKGLSSVRGRLEQVGVLTNGATVYVDYAHTPDALSAILQAVRPHVGGVLSVVFGCGGDRDAGKRPLMGRVARVHADSVIVTDDNPRGEIPDAVRKQVMAGCPDAMNIGDRRSAIFEAVHSLQAGDVLVVAGKGHEQKQILADRTIPFDDASVVREALAEIDR